MLLTFSTPTFKKILIILACSHVHVLYLQSTYVVHAKFSKSLCAGIKPHRMGSINPSFTRGEWEDIFSLYH